MRGGFFFLGKSVFVFFKDDWLFLFFCVRVFFISFCRFFELGFVCFYYGASMAVLGFEFIFRFRESKLFLVGSVVY